MIVHAAAENEMKASSLLNTKDGIDVGTKYGANLGGAPGDSIARYSSDQALIQSHGAFLLVSEKLGGRILACSVNTVAFFGILPSAVLGSSLTELFNEQDKLECVVHMSDLSLVNPVILTHKVLQSQDNSAKPRRFNAIFQRSEAGLLVDVEDCGDEAADGAWQSHRRLQKTIEKLQHASDLNSMCSLVCNDIFDCTGYDRVMMYRFHPDYHGEVVAESKRETVTESWLGLHFPSTDIPHVAREQFKANRVRMICDSAGKPVEILSEPLTIHPCADTLNCSTLRAVHPCHLEYLRNMGVRASLVLSIVVRGSLWGLIVCHHYLETRFTAYQTRTAVEFLTQAFSVRLTGIVDIEHHLQKDKRVLVHAALSENMLKGKDQATMIDGLCSFEVTMCDLIPNTVGAAVLFGDQLRTCGVVPDEDAIRRIVAWRAAKGGTEPKSICSLTRELPGVDFGPGHIAGVLCVPLVDRGMLLWFRPEIVATIRWAGNPDAEGAATGAAAPTLTPRSSFAAFAQSVVGQCALWTEAHAEAAEGLVRLVEEVLVSADLDLRGHFLLRLNAELIQTRSNCTSVAQELSHIMDTANAPIFAVSVDGTVVQWNQKCANLLNVSQEEAVGRPLYAFVAERDRGRLREIFARAVEGEETRSFEVSLLGHDLLLNASGRRDAAGRVTGIVCVGQDITETNVAMEKCRRIAVGYQRLIETSVSPIFGVDTQGQVVEWNSATAEVTRLRVEHARGQLIAGQVFGASLQLVDRCTIVQLELIISSALEGSETSNFEFSFYNRDGALVDLLVSACARRSEGEGIAGVVFFAQDITQRKALELANTIRLAAEAASMAKTEQLGFLCHEIRNPLNGVMGNIAFLEESPLDEEQSELVQTTQQCCTQLLKIMNDVLDLSKIEEGKLEVERIQFDLAVIFAAVASQIRIPAEQKGLQLGIEYEGFEHTAVVGDPVRLQQILSNFAWNSLKFTDSGSITLRAVQSPKNPSATLPPAEGVGAVAGGSGSAPLAVSAAVEGGEAVAGNGEEVMRHFVLSVVDTGLGISHEAQKKLFQPYVQADKSTARQYGGTGLGLSICKNLARLMGGDVGFVSSPGEGATFFLEIDLPVPLRPTAGQNVSLRNPVPRWHSAGPGGRNRRRASSCEVLTSETTAAADPLLPLPPLVPLSPHDGMNGSEEGARNRHSTSPQLQPARPTLVPQGSESVLYTVANSSAAGAAQPPEFTTLMRGGRWNGRVVREVITAETVIVLAEVELGGFTRQQWGAAPVPQGAAPTVALGLATESALANALRLFEPAATYFGHGPPPLPLPPAAATATPTVVPTPAPTTTTHSATGSATAKVDPSAVTDMTTAPITPVAAVQKLAAPTLPTPPPHRKDLMPALSEAEHSARPTPLAPAGPLPLSLGASTSSGLPVAMNSTTLSSDSSAAAMHNNRPLRTQSEGSPATAAPPPRPPLRQHGSFGRREFAAKQRERALAAAGGSRGDPAGTPAGKKLLRVLVVHDEVTYVKIVELALRKDGFVCTIATDGADAVRLVVTEGNTFDVILMDQSMRSLSGTEATAQIRRYELESGAASAGGSVPILALTANRGAEDCAAYAQAGFNGLIAKPVNVRTFARSIRSYLARLHSRSSTIDGECSQDQGDIEVFGPDSGVYTHAMHLDISATDGTGMKVLVIDDEPITSKIAKHALEKCGFQVECMSDGIGAVTAIQGGCRFDLILMDQVMPSMCGTEAATKIRQFEREQGLDPLNIIALTAHTDEESRKAYFRSGMDGVLSKPIRTRTLASSILAYISELQQNKERRKRRLMIRDEDAMVEYRTLSDIIVFDSNQDSMV